MTAENVENSGQGEMVKLNRRTLLVWSTPVVASLVMPAHAQTSPTTTTTQEPGCSVAPPELVPDADPKCQGSSPAIGKVQLRLRAGDSTPVIIKQIAIDTDDPKNTISDLPDLPTELTPGTDVVFTWEGPASGGATCLPLSTVTITIDYCCEGGELLTVTYDLIDLLT